jgi:ATP-dependent Clp protease ATP-binding subunit ClpA
MRERVVRRLRAVIGDDGTGAMWNRLTPDGRQVIRLAFIEARELGHQCIADEHVLLGVLRHGASKGATLLRASGLDLATVRAEILRTGPTLGPATDPAGALRAIGVDVDEMRQRLEASFGPDAVRAAERRVRRRPRWRGGHPRPNPLCVYVLAKRSFEIASGFASRRGESEVGPDHLLWGVLQDALDPVGTQLSRRNRRQLAAVGLSEGRPSPVRIHLEAHGIELPQLAAQLCPSP